jgi:hypothetical protein
MLEARQLDAMAAGLHTKILSSWDPQNAGSIRYSVLEVSGATKMLSPRTKPVYKKSIFVKISYIYRARM